MLTYRFILFDSRNLITKKMLNLERERESLKNQVLNITKEMPGNLTKDQTEITLQTKYSML